MKLKFIIFSLLIFAKDLESFKIKRGILDNLQNGLRMMGRQNLSNITYSYKHQPPSAGVSNKVADLVSFAFTKNNGQTNEKRQDAVMVGNGDVSFSPDSSLMSGFLKVLGFDGNKIGAFALNGIVFIAQMVRSSARTLFNMMMEKTWDLYLTMDQMSHKIKNETALVNNKQRYF